MNRFLTTSKRGLRAQEEGNYSLAYNLFGEVLSNSSLKDSTRIKVEIHRAECLLGSGNIIACDEHISRLEVRYRNNALCLLEIGQFYFRMAEFSAALEFFNRARKLEPSVVKIYDVIARLYIDMNRYPQAVSVLKAALKIEKPVFQGNLSTACLHVQLALCYFYIEKLELSRRHFEKAQQLDDSCIYDWDIFGRCLLKLGNYRKAVECFDRSLLEVCAEDYEVYLYKAKALICMGLMAEAKNLLLKAKKEIGELLIFPGDLRYFAPLIASGFMEEVGAILVEE